MDVSTIIAKSRIQTGTSVGQKSDVLMLQDLNIVYKDIFSRLSAKSKKYTWQRYTTDSVVGQNEYLIPKPVLSETGIKRVLNISIKYSSSSEYIPCKVYDSSIPLDSAYNNTEAPYFINRDDSIFVYPAPTQAVENGVMVEWQYLPLDLALTTTSENIKLARENHDLLVLGLNMWNFGDKQLFDKQWVQKGLFEEWMLRLLQEWGMDIESSYSETMPEASLDELA